VPQWDPEIEVDAALVQCLLEEQFPELAKLPVRLLGAGWDNTVFVVGEDEWVFRFPRREIVLTGFRLEIGYLPRLAPLLPLAIPVPEHIGVPSDGFPWPFFGARFIQGAELCDTSPSSAVELASQLGQFLKTLHGAEVMDALGAELPDNWTRRADMELRVPMISEKLSQLAELWSAPANVHAFLDEARSLPPPDPRAVCHGDMHFRHVLVDDGRVTGVIDWIDLCRGDPALDLQLVWSALPPDARPAFFAEYGDVDDETMLRARVVAVFLGTALLEFAHHEGLASVEREALASLERVASP
jgi:aminoglycoside phosphotransferase (APT) family kinase protein